MVSASWYVETGCVDVNELKPFALIAISIVIQMILACIIAMTSTSKSASGQQPNNSTQFCKNTNGIIVIAKVIYVVVEHVLSIGSIAVAY